MSERTGSDVLDRISRRERRWWRAVERRVRRQHEQEQFEALAGLAADGVAVTGLCADTDRWEPSAPVEILLAGRRLRAGRMPKRAIASLREALTSIASVPLTAVGRYGPYWVLTFRVATEHLVVLADNLTLLPDWGGPGGRGAPVGPLALTGV